MYDSGEVIYVYSSKGRNTLINDMHTIGMTMLQVQVNTKFLNALPLEWSKFVTDVKLEKSLYTTNYDQLYAYLNQHERHANELYAYLNQHERHANEVRIMRERYLDPLALVANSQTLCNSSQSSQHSDSPMYPPPQKFTQVYVAPVHHPQHPTHQGEDLFDCINKAIAFLSAVASRFPLQTINSECLPIPEIRQPFKMVESPFNKFKEDKIRVLLVLETKKLLQLQDLDAYDLDCDDISSTKAVLMANLLSYDYDVLSEVNIAPIDYSKLNNLKEDFGKCFVTQQELSTEQAFWLKHSSIFETPVKSHTPLRFEDPSKLPKVSVLNESLKKIKFKLSKFDKVVKKRLTSDAITVGSWGFEHTKECFVTGIILFLKVLKDIFNAFDKTLLDEITKVQTIFNHMEDAVHPCSVDKNDFEIKTKQLQIESDQLLNQIMSQEIMHVVVNSVDIPYVNKSCVDECTLKNELRKFKGKNVVNYVVSKPIATTTASGMFKINLEPLAPKLLKDKDVHMDGIKHSRTHDDTLWEIVENARSLSPFDSNLDLAYKCPLTRITSTKVVPTKETTTKLVVTPTQGILVYSRRPKASRSVSSSSKVKTIESNTKEPNQSWGSTVFDVPSSSLIDCRFGNDNIAKIMSYEDYQIGNVTISRVYYVEGLGYNLFSVGQFCDSDLEVAFRKHTCIISDLEGVDLDISGSHTTPRHPHHHRDLHPHHRPTTTNTTLSPPSPPSLPHHHAAIITTLPPPPPSTVATTTTTST
nr:integrase, catalytic region, zinc finger, CCHC-type, peptidase aspartic, catalytic [Tanacetum cinerariifolium]